MLYSWWWMLFVSLCFSMNSQKESRDLQSVDMKSSCPQSESHELAPYRYQLFTAYQTGYDGYEAPCEIKCLGRENCQERCQKKKGLELLGQELSRLKKKKGIKDCPSVEAICLEQCQDHGEACKQACQSSLSETKSGEETQKSKLTSAHTP